MTAVLIVDDHPVIRMGIKDILVRAGFVVKAEAKDGEEALHAVRRNSIDVITLDLSLPGKDGFQVLRELKAAQPRIPVLILTVWPEDECALQAWRDGAAGYLTKSCPPEILISALRKVVRGGRYVSANFAEKLAFEGLQLDRPAQEILSKREFQVLCLLGSGKTVSEVATELSLSSKTISTYRARVLEKLNLRNNAELVRYAIRQERPYWITARSDRALCKTS